MVDTYRIPVSESIPHPSDPTERMAEAEVVHWGSGSGSETGAVHRGSAAKAAAAGSTPADDEFNASTSCKREGPTER